jgi:hypothetical protein
VIAELEVLVLVDVGELGRGGDARPDDVVARSGSSAGDPRQIPSTGAGASRTAGSVRWNVRDPA